MLALGVVKLAAQVYKANELTVLSSIFLATAKLNFSYTHLSKVKAFHAEEAK